MARRKVASGGYLTKSAGHYASPKSDDARKNAAKSLANAVVGAVALAIAETAKGSQKSLMSDSGTDGPKMDRMDRRNRKTEPMGPFIDHPPTTDSRGGTRVLVSGSSTKPLLSPEKRLHLWSRLLLKARKAQLAEQAAWAQAVAEYHAEQEAQRAEMESWKQTWFEEHAEANEAIRRDMEKTSESQSRTERH